MTAALEGGWVVSRTPRPHFTPGKDPVPILQEAGWAPGPVWTGGKSRPHRDSIPDRPARSSVAVPTELPDAQYIYVKVKVKWSRYRPGVAQSLGRGIALLFHERGTRRGVSGQQHVPAALYPRERLGTHFTGGWVGPRAGLDRRKISSPPGFDI